MINSINVAAIQKSSRKTKALTALALATVILVLALPAAGQSEEGTIGLSVLNAVILGLVEGLTEYLPVSSTGHLLVATDLLDLGGTPAEETALEAYAICIQAGAILAVLVVYQARVRQMIDGILGRSEEGRMITFAVGIAFTTTAVFALALGSTVRDRLFSVGPVATAWLIGGLAILALGKLGLFERAGTELNEITFRQAALIGLGQAIALWPGTSRSLITIVVAVLVGMSLHAAVEFSFLLGLVTLTAATLLTALQDGELLVSTFGYQTPAIGLVVAFVSAIVSVRWMVSWLQQRSFDVFGYYRILIGAAALGAMAAGWL